MNIFVSIFENGELIDKFEEQAENITSIVKETLKTNKKYDPTMFERYTGETWVMFKRFGKQIRIIFAKE